jgi:hypothetical protein
MIPHLAALATAGAVLPATLAAVYVFSANPIASRPPTAWFSTPCTRRAAHSLTGSTAPATSARSPTAAGAAVGVLGLDSRATYSSELKEVHL